MNTKFQSFQVVVGGSACNARCPFCISKTTPPQVTIPRAVEADMYALQDACRIAERSGVWSAMITGKGEPMLWPHQVGWAAKALREWFPVIEVQTSGTRIVSTNARDLRLAGVRVVALSVVSLNQEENAACYGGEHFNLVEKVAMLHDVGLNVRLTVTMCKGWVDDIGRVLEVIDWCRENRVEQLTLRPVNAPGYVVAGGSGKEIQRWAIEHVPQPPQLSLPRTGVCPPLDFVAYLRDRLVQVHGARVLLRPMEGMEIFDVHGQNVALAECLKMSSPEIGAPARNLIFIPPRTIAFDWQYAGARIL